MTDIEIPLGKRTKLYRFFEMLPGMLSTGAVVLLIVLSLLSPTIAAIYILVLVIIMFVRAFGTAYRTIQGRRSLMKSEQVDWAKRLADLSHPIKSLKEYDQLDAKARRANYKLSEHLRVLQNLAEHKADYPTAKQTINVCMVAFYNESYEILGSTLKNLSEADYDIAHNLIVVIAYEQRGGAAALKTVEQIKKHWTGVFRDLIFVEHPANLPDEVVGKGANLVYAGHELVKYVRRHHIDLKNVIVTSMDSDNRPDKKYFAYLTYEWIITPDRQQVAFQPICLFNNNLWDVPAPMRVVATSNSFWNVISSMRPNILRNFASHAQGLWALEQMGFWSKRTIVEDGHQYWRSYFFFDGHYRVVPLRIGIGQDAVLSDTFKKTLKAQFIQLRRWAYGASDVAYVATMGLKKDCKCPKPDLLGRFGRLLEGHVSQACMAPIVGFGAFAPIFLNPIAAHNSIIANDLPLIVSYVQKIAVIGLFVTVITSLSLLPPRPKRYKKTRNIFMILQWVLMPVTAIVYTSMSAYVAQWKLLTGHYLVKFDVTEKAVKKTSK